MLQLPTDRQPQPYTLLERTRGVAQLGELLEDPRLLIATQPAAIIHHGDAHLLIPFAHHYLHPCGAGMHQRIVEIVAHQPFQQQRIGIQSAA